MSQEQIKKTSPFFSNFKKPQQQTTTTTADTGRGEGPTSTQHHHDMDTPLHRSHDSVVRAPSPSTSLVRASTLTHTSSFAIKPPPTNTTTTTTTTSSTSNNNNNNNNDSDNDGGVNTLKRAGVSTYMANLMNDDSEEDEPPKPSSAKATLTKGRERNIANKLVKQTTQRKRNGRGGSADALTIAEERALLNLDNNNNNGPALVATKRQSVRTAASKQAPSHVITVLALPDDASKKSVPPQSTYPSSLPIPQSLVVAKPTQTHTSKPTLVPAPSPQSGTRRSSRNIPEKKKELLTPAEKLEYEKLLKLIDEDKRSLPLIWAAKTTIVPYVTFLISIINKEGVNIDVNHQDGIGKTALHYAAQRGYKEVCRILLQNNANVSIKDTNYDTPLFLAAQSKQEEQLAVVELLLQHGADVGAKNNKNFTVLHLSAGAGNQPLIATLARYCKNPVDSYTDKVGRTCLFSAIKYFKLDMINFLISVQNVDPLVMDIYECNCMHYCAQEAKVLFMTVLNAASKKFPGDIKRFIETTDKMGRTPLHFALRKDSKEPIKIVKKLIHLGVNVNAQETKSGDTPLHLAARTGPLILVQLLVTAGASPNTRNRLGELPLDVAPHADVVSALRKATVASPKRKRTDTDSDEDSNIGHTDPAPRMHAIELLKKGFAQDITPEKRRKEDSKFFGGPDDSTILAQDDTKQLKTAVHHIHLNNNNNNINTQHVNSTTSSNANNSNNITPTNNNNPPNTGTEVYTNSAPLATQATPFPLDAQPLAVTLGPLAQQYMIVEEDLVMGDLLGTGSFGEVVRGTWKNNPVAIKCMHKNLQSMQQAVTLYVNEIEIMCRVRHGNVVRIFGCTKPPLVYIVMDYYPFNLQQLIQQSVRIPTPFLLKIAKGIANGLFYLHNVAKIIHRDMKPSNVLLDHENNPKIADFGVARENAGTLTMTGIGTPTYMAPEMLKGRKYSDKVDVYSFGLIVWQMFTGLKPFADLKMNDGAEMSPVQIAVKVATERIRPKIPPDCPPSLQQLIVQCWEHDPKRRLSSEELVKILEDC